MNKILLSIICFLAYVISLHAQTLYAVTPNGGNDRVGSLIKFTPGTNNLTVAKSFENNAKYPQYTNFIQASNGKLYGMTLYGGNDSIGGTGYGGGVIFSFDPSTSTYTQLKSFDGTDGVGPNGSLMQANDGKLYGMTAGGGGSNHGVIFSFDPSTSNYTKLKDFDGTNGSFPNGSLLQASDGKLYGMTSQGGSSNRGVIFSFDPSTSTYTKLKDFDGNNGYNPLGSLMQASDGMLYGMTNLGGNGPDVYNRGAGVIFSFDPSTSTYTKLKDFDGTNGANPYGNLMQASNGKLYGMTALGGNKGVGVIFSFDLSSSTYTKLKDFDYPDGDIPFGSLIQASDGKFYGMTADGGNGGAYNYYGVIFSFDPSSSTYTKLKDFDGINGHDPNGSLMQASNGKLYGMTTDGGSSFQGVIFSFDPSSSTFTKLKDFEAIDGRNPSASLMQASNGKLYGMTPAGGHSDVGVIYSFDPSTSIYTKLMDFDVTIGAYPSGSLMQASDGKLYGMAKGAGGGNGHIFSFDPSTSIYIKLIDFDGTNGGAPNGSLMQAGNGKLYGVTTGGGSNGDGVIFSFDPSSSVYTKLKDFDVFANGAQPYGSLIQASNGKLYGMTHYGGNNAAGVIFSFDPSTSTYTKLKDFNRTSNYGPYGSLIQASNGKLYGMTLSEGSIPNASNGFGNIFSFDPSSSTYTNLKEFDGINGLGAYGNLMQASDGKLYGMTYQGGSSNHGVIFSFDPPSSTYTKLQDFDGNNGANPYLSSGFIELSNSGGTGIIPVLSIAISSGTNPICAGQSITFTATPTNGGSAPLYQWKVNGNNAGPNSSTYTTTTLTDGQLVSCVMTSNAPNANPTTATSNTITMTVNSVETPTIVITQTFCGRDSLNSSSTITFSSTITNGGTAPTYLWVYTGTGTTTNNTGSDFTLHAPSNGNQVQCTLTSNASCADSLQVNSSPLIINCITTGVSNIDDLEEFKIMPNPNNGLFTVKIKLNTQKQVRFSVLNSLAQPVYQSPLTRMNGTQTKQISVSPLPGAVYFLKTEIGNQVIYKRIIIIKN